MRNYGIMGYFFGSKSNTMIDCMTLPSSCFGAYYLPGFILLLENALSPITENIIIEIAYIHCLEVNELSFHFLQPSARQPGRPIALLVYQQWLSA
jgi:hypothetical protein